MPPKLLTTVGAEWRAKGVDSAPWGATAEERPCGESQGFWVEHGGLRGLLKPSKPDAADIRALPRAAHEKIAADLAFDLGLPVPPAVLVDGKACGGLVQAAVVSLVLYPEVHRWDHVTATPASLAIGSHILRSTRAAWSGIVAFDAWLGNTDRHNATNLLIGIDTSTESPSAEAVFCDYANSMLYSQWKKGSCPAVAVPDVVLVLSALRDRDAALATAEKIRAYSAEKIAEIVNRIPETHLAPEGREVIIECLAERGKAVPDVVAASTKRG